MSVLPSLRPRLTAFAVVDADTKAPIGTSAPLFAPLCFTVSFTVDRPLLATAAGDACADARLCVSVEFIADVASEQPAVALLTRQAVAPAAAVDEDSNTTKSDNAATLSSSSPATTAQESRNDNSVLLVPGTVYELTCTLRDLRALQGVPLKHLLQVSMMRVRLVAANSTADDDLNKPGKVGVVAAWNVVWQVRRDPANEKELVRTVLNPLL